jgi:SAM-dependent methyltransferase
MWNNRSDNYFGDIQLGIDIIQKNAERAFPAKVWQMISRAFADLRGKRVLVPSSGDNIAVFGFHLLGAVVTSCDLAERQLFNAKKIADEHGWDIKFIQQNSMDLDGIPDAEYDLVYTSNGVHVWINDLPKMYQNFNRVLKQGGQLIMFETHPFIRPFDTSYAVDSKDWKFVVKKPYGETGPFHFGETTEFGWRIQDIFNSAFGAGFVMQQMEEFHTEAGDWDIWFYDNVAEGEKDGYSKAWVA